MKLFQRNYPSSEEAFDQKFIRTADYEQLERVFQIHKYYPKFFHNDGISTPELRDLIVDKPIYKDANRQARAMRNNRNTNKMIQTVLDEKCPRSSHDLVQDIQTTTDVPYNDNNSEENYKLENIESHDLADAWVWDIGRGITLPRQKGSYTYTEREINRVDIDGENDEIEDYSPDTTINEPLIFNDPFNSGKTIHHKVTQTSKFLQFMGKLKRSASHQPNIKPGSTSRNRKLIVSRDSKRTMTSNSLSHKVSHTNNLILDSNPDVYLVPSINGRAASFDQTKSQTTLTRKIIDKLYMGKSQYSINDAQSQQGDDKFLRRNKTKDLIGMYFSLLLFPKAG